MLFSVGEDGNGRPKDRRQRGHR